MILRESWRAALLKDHPAVKFMLSSLNAVTTQMKWHKCSFFFDQKHAPYRSRWLFMTTLHTTNIIFVYVPTAVVSGPCVLIDDVCVNSVLQECSDVQPPKDHLFEGASQQSVRGEEISSEGHGVHRSASFRFCKYFGAMTCYKLTSGPWTQFAAHSCFHTATTEWSGVAFERKWMGMQREPQAWWQLPGKVEFSLNDSNFPCLDISE